jgi:hypothetical protein
MSKAVQVEHLIAGVVDDNGEPLSGGKVYTYAAGTLDSKTTWTNRSKGSSATNPIILDSEGKTLIFADGIYKFVIHDSTDTEVSNSPIDNLAFGLVEGPWIDVSEYSDLTAAITAIGSTETDLLIDSVTTLTANTTIPATIRVKVTRAGSINQGAYTLEINGPFKASPTSIFTGTGAVTFRGGHVIKITSQWWGVDEIALQAAIDSVKDANERVADDLIDTGIIELSGRNIIDTPLKLYSGQVLIGTGTSTTLEEGGGFVGTELITLEGTTYNENCTINDMTFVATTLTVAAIGQNVTNVVALKLNNILLDCPRGIILDSYAQDCRLTKIFSYGPIDLLLHLKGNFNIIRELTKESGTGSSIDPYIFIEDHASSNSNGNRFEGTLIEGTGSANKTPLKIDGVDLLTFVDTWFETNVTNGYAVDIDNSRGLIHFKGILQGVNSTDKFKARNSYKIVVDHFNCDHVIGPLSDYIDIDSTVNLSINSLLTRFGQCASILDTNRNIHIKENVNRSQILDGVIAGWNPIQLQEDLTGQNLFVNPSFEAGSYGWTVVNSPSTDEYISSEVNTGLMGHYILSGAVMQVYQGITITSDMVGRDITFTGLAKATIAGRINPFFNGAGVTQGTNQNYLDFGEGWGIISGTCRPTTNGTLNVGFYVVLGTTSTNLYIDDACVSVGQKALVNPTKMESVDIGGQTWIIGSVAPTTGTWKVGDKCWDSVPTASGTIGWVCTSAGTPGTWKTFGTIAS